MKEPLFFTTGGAFRQWLVTHAASAPELIVGYHRVGTGHPSMTWSESVDEALCFGWIDGVRKRIDEGRYQIRFTPRKPTSIWSAVNIAKIDQLRLDGRMTAAGETAFAHRRAERSVVYAYEQTAMAELSPEHTEVFAANHPAWQFFLATPPGYQRLMRHWVAGGKKPETRAARLARLVEACAAGVRLR